MPRPRDYRIYAIFGRYSAAIRNSWRYERSPEKRAIIDQSRPSRESASRSLARRTGRGARGVLPRSPRRTSLWRRRLEGTRV